MAVCTPVTRDSLLANYQLVPSDVVGSMRAMIVGLDYAYRPYSFTTADGLIGAYDESTGVIAGWPSLAANETVEQASAVVVVRNALANYYADAGAPPGASQGAQSGTTPNAIVHNGGATIWAGSSFTPALGNAVAVGDYVKLDNTIGTTLETKVSGFGYVGGQPTILLLEDSLPAALTGGAFFNVILAEIVPLHTLASSDLTLSATQVQADPGITLSTDRTGGSVDLIAGQTYTGTDLSTVYTSYRALRTASPATTQVLTIATTTSLSSNFVGWEYPESGLGFAVSRALGPTPEEGDSLPNVLCTAPVTDDSAGWSTAIGRIQSRVDWYAVAPLTYTSSIHSLFQAMLTVRATNGVYGEMFISKQLTEETTILSGSGNTVLIDQSQTPGLNRTVTRDGGVTDPFVNAQADDIVQIAGVDYVIDTKISNQVVTIKTSASGGAGQVLNEIRHPLTAQEQAVAFGAAAAAIGNREVSVVFPPEPEWGGSTVEGYMLAAATAGLRGYTIPQQPLTGVQLESGWGAPQSSSEFFPYLDLLATYGVFVYEQSYTVDEPNAIVYRANTTDQSSTIYSREGYVANEDAIRRYMSNALSCAPSTKVVNAVLGNLVVRASGALTYLETNTIVAPWGATVVGGNVGNAFVSPSSDEIVIVPVTAEIAPTLEAVEMQIQVDLQAIV